MIRLIGKAWLTIAIFGIACCAISLAQSAPLHKKVKQFQGISLARALQIAKKYVAAHEAWAAKAIYPQPKLVGDEWLIVVRPSDFYGEDGPEHLIVIDKRGKVIHYYKSD